MTPFDPIWWAATQPAPRFTSVHPPRVDPVATNRTRRFVYADESKVATEPQLPPGCYYQSTQQCECYEPRVIAGNWCRQCSRSTVGGWYIAFYEAQ